MLSPSKVTQNDLAKRGFVTAYSFRASGWSNAREASFGVDLRDGMGLFEIAGLPPAQGTVVYVLLETEAGSNPNPMKGAAYSDYAALAEETANLDEDWQERKPEVTKAFAAYSMGDDDEVDLEAVREYFEWSAKDEGDRLDFKVFEVTLP